MYFSKRAIRMILIAKDIDPYQKMVRYKVTGDPIVYPDPIQNIWKFLRYENRIARI